MGRWGRGIEISAAALGIVAIVTGWLWPDRPGSSGSDEPDPPSPQSEMVDPTPDISEPEPASGSPQGPSSSPYTIVDFEGTAIINAENAALYSLPSVVTGSAMTRLRIGERVHLTGKVEGLPWYRASLAGEDYFIPTQSISNIKETR